MHISAQFAPEMLIYNDKLNAMPSMSEHLQQLHEMRLRKYNSK
jgi:hypothetical protein